MAKTKTVKQEAWGLIDKKDKIVRADRCPDCYLISTTMAHALTICLKSEGETVRPVTISWTVEE